MCELIDLTAKEDQSKENHSNYISAETFYFPLVHRRDRQGHQERTHQKNEGREGS